MGMMMPGGGGAAPADPMGGIGGLGGGMNPTMQSGPPHGTPHKGHRTKGKKLHGGPHTSHKARGKGRRKGK